MAASSTSGPDGPRGLSAREKKILAEIEYDLLVADPTLARHLECAHWPRIATRRAGSRPRHRALLIAALIILIIAATAVPSGWWAAWACSPPSY